jgi:UDP-3-O-[3-hydroxymyristoyl] glucosamine N-acyltransferase
VASSRGGPRHDDQAPEIADSAYVDPTARIGSGCVISDFAYIGPGVKVGARTVVGPGAVLLEGCEIGQDCTIAGEAVLGARGFGYVFDGTQHLRIPQIGKVVLGDRTAIGPATCIDRAALDETRIGSDCRIGALTQIAHNCHIGDDSRIGGGCGLAGSSRIGRGARFGDRTGTAGHSQFGEAVVLEDMCAVTRTLVPGGTRWAGYPGRMVKE